MALSKIGSDAIVNDSIGPNQLDEAANYTFTGTVTGAGVSNTPLFYARATGQTINNNTTTKISSFIEIIDTDNTFDVSNHRWIPKETGYYLHFYRNGLGGPTGESAHQVYFKKNGANFGGDYIMGNSGTVAYYYSTWGSSGDSNYWFVNITENLNSDYYEMYMVHNQGSSQAHNGDWTCFKIS